MDWNVAGFEEANHNPVAALNGNTDLSVGTAVVAPGTEVHLNAAGSSDPDADQIFYRWFAYQDIGNITSRIELAGDTTENLTFTMPQLRRNQALHIILEVRDDGAPSLFSYRRVILRNP